MRWGPSCCLCRSRRAGSGGETWGREWERAGWAAPRHVSSSSPAGIEGGLGRPAGGARGQALPRGGLAGLWTLPRPRPPPHPGSASQIRRGPGPRSRCARGKQREPSGARKPVPGSGGLEVTAVTSGRGPRGVRLAHRVSDLDAGPRAK